MNLSAQIGCLANRKFIYQAHHALRCHSRFCFHDARVPCLSGRDGQGPIRQIDSRSMRIMTRHTVMLSGHTAIEMLHQIPQSVVHSDNLPSRRLSLQARGELSVNDACFVESWRKFDEDRSLQLGTYDT